MHFHGFLLQAGTQHRRAVALACILLPGRTVLSLGNPGGRFEYGGLC